MLTIQNLENLRRAQAHVEKLLRGEVIEQINQEGFEIAMDELVYEAREKARENEEAAMRNACLRWSSDRWAACLRLGGESPPRLS